MRAQSWKSYCCSIECYEKYTKEVIEARQKGKVVEVSPIRTDMTSEQIASIMSEPMEKATAYTVEVELKDYIEDNPDKSLNEIVDMVNEDIAKNNNEESDVVSEHNNQRSKRKRKKNNV